MFKAGKVAIIGRPNVGKSTLLNVMVKEKVCIVSEKPETTRDNIQGILSGEDFQVVFVDTPGIHRPKNLLGKLMVRKAQSSLMETDLNLVLIDAHSGITKEDIEIFNLMPVKLNILIINKIDGIDRRHILPIIEKAHKFNFKEIIPISALKKDGTDLVFKKILEYLPEGFPFFPDDQLTDKNERFIVQELIREKILEITYQEVPHSIAVTVEEMEERKDRENNNIIYIKANIYCEKESQKGIIIGDGGKTLKKIGEITRKDIENFLQKKVFLDLWVKVYKNWRKDPFALKNLGY
ncbi:MAG: GTPase Era [Omnitrophica bacterium GWA2_41_15]|nr:MAG: GTPase Era [Omnitrophica bacterium GWA2_41_15]HAZ10087.1 GTPase Era [Candidatus Omnitrophota bacterium]